MYVHIFIEFQNVVISFRDTRKEENSTNLSLRKAIFYDGPIYG